MFTLHRRSSEAGTTAEFLCTDLDGTILIGDSFWESFLALVGVHPWYVFFIPFWLLRGKAALKHEISRRVQLNVSTLPVREELIEFLRQQKQAGRKLILATGADAKIASAVAEHFGFFDAVLASDGATNLTGEKKKEAIREIVRGKSFDYIGNARDDIPAWNAASTAILVGPSPRLLKTVKKTSCGRRSGKKLRKLLGFAVAVFAPRALDQESPGFRADRHGP